MVTEFLQSHSTTAILLVMLVTFTLAAVACTWPWRKVTLPQADTLAHEAHRALWEVVVNVAQGQWLHSADDFCLWVALDGDALHIERLPGSVFVDRTPGARMSVTLVTSVRTQPEVLARATTALVGDDRDLVRSLLPEGHGGSKLAAYDIRRVRDQLVSARVLI